MVSDQKALTGGWDFSVATAELDAYRAVLALLRVTAFNYSSMVKCSLAQKDRNEKYVAVTSPAKKMGQELR